MNKFFCQKKYDTTMQMIKSNDLANLRLRTKILIVDDEYDAIVEVLTARKYDVYYKRDMSYAVEAEPFDIILMDIKGVGRVRQSQSEGYGLAVEIKRDYPMKKVSCFSSVSDICIFQDFEKAGIGFIKKDTEPDKICEKLDDLIKDYVDVKKQWEVLRKVLIDNDISGGDIQIIEKAYYAAFETKKFDNVYFTIMGIVKNTGTMLNGLTSVLTLMKILAN